MAAGDQFCVFILDEKIGGLPHSPRTMILEVVHELSFGKVVNYARSDLAIALAPAAIDSTMF
ncbi:Uncharacterised protein [Mycobacterium tuberculosis]|nr:Uncharacterised protein [Mycobacterium tuberculosis]